MTETNTIAGEQQHSPAQLSEGSWQSILSYVSGRLQHSDPSKLMPWQMIRFAIRR